MTEQKGVAARRFLVPKLVRIFGAFLILVILGVWISSTHAFKLATTHQPERFTELYFVDPTALPTVITAGKPYAGSFAVVNHEGRTMSYQYQVTITEAGQVVRQTTNFFSIASGQRMQKSFSFAAEQPKHQVQITVALVTKQQVIHFRAES